jgi:chromosomal replication initiator protein
LTITFYSSILIACVMGLTYRRHNVVVWMSQAARATLCGFMPKEGSKVLTTSHHGKANRASAEQQGGSMRGEPPQLAAQWARIRGRLQQEVGEVLYRTWLRDMTLSRVDGDEVTILLPSAFQRDWVRTHYSDRLNELWQAEGTGIRRVEFQNGRTGAGDADRMAGAETPAEAAVAPFAGPASASGAADRLSEVSAPLDPRFHFDNFVVGKPNEFAYACARRVADTPNSPGFNPLFLYGDVGLGKTHLMHAIGLELKRPGRPAIQVAYMSAEKFMYRFITAIRSQSTMEFKEQLRSVDVLMIDDLQFLIGKDNTQEEFFHTFNALVDAGRQIVVSADKSPSDLSGIEQRLRTRLGCGMVADLHSTTFELRLSILEAKAGRADVDVPTKVLEFLAHKIDTNVRELEGCLNRLVAHASLFNRAITLESAQDVLRDVLKSHDRRVTIEEIQKRVAEHWGLRVTDMTSSRRARTVARPRQVAMYLAKQFTDRSLPEIGRMFGNRDHTTVMHAVSRVAELMEADPDFKEQVELMQGLLKR